jgi:hypothetical protein
MMPPNHQRLVASVQKSGREEFRITLRDYSDGTIKCEIRVFERHRDGDWEPTPRHIVIGRDYLLDVVQGLLEASALLKAEAAA